MERKGGRVVVRTLPVGREEIWIEKRDLRLSAKTKVSVLDDGKKEKSSVKRIRGHGYGAGLHRKEGRDLLRDLSSNGKEGGRGRV